MRIFYDKEKTKEIEDKIQAKFGENTKEWAKDGYNVSEVSGCEVKCFNRRTGVEERITKKSIGFLVFGIVSENIVAELYPEEQRQYELNLFKKIFGHVDVCEDFKYSIECKATAKRIFKATDLPVYWVMQLINYITMSKTNKGWLYILDLFTRHYAAFCIQMSKEDKLLQIEVLMDKKVRYDKAIETKDASELKIMPEGYSFCNFKHGCSRRLECRDKFKLLKEKKK